MCQTVVINSIEDFCLWSAPEPNSEIGATEQIEVAYCTREGRGTRSIPAGVLTGVHFRQVSEGHLCITLEADVAVNDRRPPTSFRSQVMVISRK